MKFSFWDFLFNRKGKDIPLVIELGSQGKGLIIQKLAYEICVQRIAKAICKCEFRTYNRGKEEKKDLYYKLNVRPNPNQSATEFWQAFVEKLYNEQEVLIIESGGDLFIADSYDLDDKPVLKPQTFSHVKVGAFEFNKTFSMTDVGFFRLSNQKIKSLLETMLLQYTDLIDAATMAYKNAVGIKAKLHIGARQEAKFAELNKVFQKNLKTFFETPNACYFEYDGYDFQAFDSSRKGTQQSTRDIKAMLDDVLELTCKAFLMPTNIVTGEVTDTSKAVDDFLTFCLDSVFALIEDGLNGALFKPEQYLKGTYIKINSQAIKHVDVLDASGAIDKLISCGAKSINDILRIMGDAPIDEEWARKHWITKNYTSIDSLEELNVSGKEEISNEDVSNDIPDESQSETG